MQEQVKRHCLFCRNEIDRDAILCIHCNSFQNWRRILLLISSFAALVVAGVSFVPIGISYIGNMMTPKNSDIVARYRNLGGTKERTFLFTILNSGNRTGEVGNVTLQARIDGCFDVPLRLYSHPAVEFVQPGEMKRLILYVLDSPIGIKEKIQQCAGKKLECTITINGNDFTGENKVLNPSDMIIPGNDCEEVIQSRIQKS